MTFFSAIGIFMAGVIFGMVIAALMNISKGGEE